MPPETETAGTSGGDVATTAAYIPGTIQALTEERLVSVLQHIYQWETWVSSNIVREYALEVAAAASLSLITSQFAGTYGRRWFITAEGLAFLNECAARAQEREQRSLVDSTTFAERQALHLPITGCDCVPSS
jgi:hypothetical protein